MKHTTVRVGRLVLLVAAMVAAAGCAWTDHKSHVESYQARKAKSHHKGHAKCKEPALGAVVKDLPPLQVLPGLDTPDTRNAIKIPPLSEPERARAPNDPCLSSPPDFKG
jgi:hypothetical protein